MTSSSANSTESFVQIVDNVIETSLVENVVTAIGTLSPSEEIYTELARTPACDFLLQTYREKIHPSVISRPQIARFVKSPEDTQKTFKMIASINPSARSIAIRKIGLPTDYHIIIPLVLEGLPRWVEVRSSQIRCEIPWSKGSVVYIKGGTNLVCTDRGGGIYILIGGKVKGH